MSTLYFSQISYRLFINDSGSSSAFGIQKKVSTKFLFTTVESASAPITLISISESDFSASIVSIP